MQQVISFSQMSFWTSQPDIKRLNDKIGELNRDGWRVTSVVPATGIWGRISSYTLLIESENSSRRG